MPIKYPLQDYSVSDPIPNIISVTAETSKVVNGILHIEESDAIVFRVDVTSLSFTPTTFTWNKNGEGWTTQSSNTLATNLDVGEYEIQVNAFTDAFAAGTAGAAAESATAIVHISVVTSESPSLVENPIYAPFRARIKEVVSPTEIRIDRNINDYKEGLVGLQSINADVRLPKWKIRSQFQNMKDFTTLLRLGNDNTALIVNYEVDTQTFSQRPNSIIYKLYKPISDSVNIKDSAYIVREMIPPHVEHVKLVEFEESDLGDYVLRQKDIDSLESPVVKRKTEFKNYNQLVGSGSEFVVNKLVNEHLSGSISVKLNIDYNRYQNYSHFGSARMRVENFRTKLENIEFYNAQSQSLDSYSGSLNDIRKYENLKNEVINNFDGYERHLYFDSSSAYSSSLGQFFDTAWPKTGGSGNIRSPYTLANTTASIATTWYSQSFSSASFYDLNNQNRMANLLPDHITGDPQNETFLKFMDMVGHYFDDIWAYIKALGDLTDRRQKITEGLAKDLAFDLAKSMGWELKTGKDLLELSQYTLGLDPSGSNYPTYSDTPESDIEKEIWKRIMLNIPYFLKTKGTGKALKALIACYGIPSTILRIKEYGGLNFSGSEAIFEITRKFTRAVDFKGGQFVSSSWPDQDSKKPHTVELRFKAASGSTQTLVQKNDGVTDKSSKWAIILKDNDSPDNKGYISFKLSGSDGYKEISSSLFPVFDGDFWSVMVRKKKVSANNLSPITNSLSGTHWANGARGGTLTAHSGSEKRTEFSLRHTATGDDSSTLGHHLGGGASLVSASKGNEIELSVFAAASSSNNMEKGDAKVQIQLFELDSKEKILEFAESQEEFVDTNWKSIRVRKTITNPSTKTVSMRLKNVRSGDTVFYDDLSLVTGSTAYSTDERDDAVASQYMYELFTKKYDSGRSDIQYDSRESLYIDGAVAASHSYNGAWSASGDLYLGGSGSTFGKQFTGSMMEFRLWTTPLKEARFENHVAAPKAMDGNHPSASFTDLPLRFSFDDNKNLSTDKSIPNVAPDQVSFGKTGSLYQSGSADGFANETNYSSVVDEMKMFVPNAGPNRRNAKKIRIEATTLVTGSSLENFDSGSGDEVDFALSRRIRREISEFDKRDVESNRLSLFFSPVDVINEDIILSVGDLDFNQYLGDPRDQFTYQYRGLQKVANQYWQKYRGKNNFWDYIQTIKYYDQSMWEQFKKLIPAKAKTTLGVLVEANIFERPKVILGQPPSHERVDYTTEINVGLMEETGSDLRAVMDITGSKPMYEGTISESLFRDPSLYLLGSSASLETSVYDQREGRFYATASVKSDFGSGSQHEQPTKYWSEAVFPFISASRFSEKYVVKDYFYSQSLANGQGQHDAFLTGSFAEQPGDQMPQGTGGGAYSSSYSESPYHPIKTLTISQRRLFFEGCVNKASTTYGTIGGVYNIQSTEPVEVFGSSPTAIVKAPGAGAGSKLQVKKKGGFDAEV